MDKKSNHSNEPYNNRQGKETNFQSTGETGLGEECGVFGMYDLDGADVAPAIYYGLFSCSTEDKRAAVLPSAVQTGQNVTHVYAKGWDLSMK